MMETLKRRKTKEIAKYFQFTGIEDGKLTKERRWKAYRYWLTLFREERFGDLDDLKNEFQARVFCFLEKMLHLNFVF